MENSAYTYTKTTVRSTVVGKQYALCTTDGVNVREGRTEDARVVGVMKQNTLCYILADADSEWIFVESGDVRGFVKREYLSTGDGVENQILEKWRVHLFLRGSQDFREGKQGLLLYDHFY